MSYCSVQDIRKALARGAASSGTNTPADLDDEDLQDAADEASSVVDGYIDGPYDTEVDDIPSTVVFWTRDIAAYLAALMWRGAKAPAANNPITLRYQHAMTMLEAVADGRITIVGPENAEDQPTVVNQYNVVLIRPGEFDLWGRGENLEGWPLHVGPGYVYWPGVPN